MRILVLSYHPATHLGGSEIQCDLLARHLTRSGHDVVFGAISSNRSDFRDVERNYVIRPVASRSYRDLLEAMLEVAPDIVYWRASRAKLLRAVLIARALGIKFVFAIAGVGHVRRYSFTPVAHADNLRSTAKYGLLKARQLVLSRLNFEAYRLVDGVSSNVAALLDQFPSGPNYTPHRRTIYNMMEATTEGTFDWPRPYVVWVANLKKNKNPEAYIEAARRLVDLDLDFLMVGDIHQEEYAFVRSQDAVPKNFHYLGRRSPREVNTILSGALLLVHTCEPEGFCGNFIQAWFQGVPTVSLYHDPDNVIETHNVGRLSGDVASLVRDIRGIVNDPILRKEMGARALRLADRKFAPESNANEYARFFQEILSDEPHEASI